MAQAVIMIRPSEFAFNEEAAKDNSFAKNITPEEHHANRGFEGPAKSHADSARHEFDQIVHALRSHGISTLVFDDLEPSVGPDAIFLNNWFSTHEDGTLVVYPMCHPSRRKERRKDIVDYLKHHYQVSRVWDLTSEEQSGVYLEATGSMVFDHDTRTIYASISQRTNRTLVDRVAKDFGYTSFIVNTKCDIGRLPIYHTNVFMSVGKNYMIVCLDLIVDQTHVEELEANMKHSGKEVINITYDQVKNFCGNVLQVQNTSGELFTIMSQKSFRSFSPDQLHIIEKHSKIIHCNVETIQEIGGGGIRCMLAENWLKKRSSD